MVLQISSLQVALLETPSRVFLDQAYSLTERATMRLLTLRFDPFETKIQLDHAPPCAQCFVAPPQRLAVVKKLFECSKLLIHDFAYKIIEFLQVEHDNVVRWQRIGDLQVREIQKIVQT